MRVRIEPASEVSASSLSGKTRPVRGRRKNAPLVHDCSLEHFEHRNILELLGDLDAVRPADHDGVEHPVRARSSVYPNRPGVQQESETQASKLGRRRTYCPLRYLLSKWSRVRSEGLCVSAASSALFRSMRRIFLRKLVSSKPCGARERSGTHMQSEFG